MIKRFKAFYNKEDFDYSAEYVDPFEFHKTFYFCLKRYKVTSLKYKYDFCNQNMFIVIVRCIHLAVVSMSFLHGLESFDIAFMTESGVYTILEYYALLIISCTKTNLPQFVSLLDSMKEDFEYICNTGKKYRKKYFENQIETWKTCLFITVFICAVAVMLIVSNFVALGYFYLTHTPGDGRTRPMLYPLWIPNHDITESPTYEMLVTLAITGVTIYAYIYIYMMQTQIVWVRHIMSKADIVIWSIEDLFIDIRPTRNPEERKRFANILKKRLSEIVMQHQSMYRLLDDFSQVYKKLLLMEQVICAPIVCFTAYSTVLKFEEGSVHMPFLLLLITSLVVFFIPSYLGTFLLLKITSIVDACWNIPLWDADPLITPYIVLIMQRSLRPLPLQAAGFEEISLKTFSGKMANAYSCFNMLRQINI